MLFIVLAAGNEFLSRAAFLDSVFELADVWTAGVSAEEYAAFLRRAHFHITEVRCAAMSLHGSPRYVSSPFTSPLALWERPYKLIFYSSSPMVARPMAAPPMIARPMVALPMMLTLC